MAVCLYYVSIIFIILSFIYLYFRDLGSTQIQSLPIKLIHNNTDLRHLRLESNGIQDIPHGFFNHSSKLTSLIIDHNEIQSLNPELFYPLKSLNDIHLQHNTKFEMYCDYGLGDLALFPNLRSIYMHSMSHKCIQPWIKNIKLKRPDLQIESQPKEEKLKICPLIEIEHLPSSIQQNIRLSVQFKGPKLYIKHKAYWISHSIHRCSDFRSMLFLTFALQ